MSVAWDVVVVFLYETSFAMCLFVGTREADEAAGVCDEEA